MTYDTLVIAPFRRPVFRTAISPFYSVEEPFDSPPLHIAAKLEEAGHAVQYLPLQNFFNGFDGDKDHKDLQKLLKKYPAKLVIFSSDNFIPSRSTATLYGVRIIAQLLKAMSNQIIIGVTGRLATTLRERLFTLVDELDFLVIGEAECVIDKAIESVLSQVNTSQLAHPNVMLKKHEDYLMKQVRPAYVENANQIATPAYHLLEKTIHHIEELRNRPLKNLPFSLRTSLGCKFRCLFCAGVPFWRNYRTKTLASVAREVAHFHKHLGGVGRISFLEDEIFTLNETHVAEVSQLFKQEKILLDGLYTHSTLLNKNISHMLNEVTDRVFLGLDNADDTVLKKMAKGQQFEAVLEKVELARSSGLKVHLEWIIGAPHETINTLIKTLGAIHSLLVTGVVETINTYVYCPHPGTEYAENCDRYGLEILGSLDDIQESGGYPASATQHLSRNQVYIAYLMSQIVINEALQFRSQNGIMKKVRSPNYVEMKRLFDTIQSDDRRIH